MLTSCSLPVFVGCDQWRLPCSRSSFQMIPFRWYKGALFFFVICYEMRKCVFLYSCPVVLLLFVILYPLFFSEWFDRSSYHASFLFLSYFVLVLEKGQKWNAGWLLPFHRRWHAVIHLPTISFLMPSLKSAEKAHHWLSYYFFSFLFYHIFNIITIWMRNIHGVV